ncbi:MAG: sulfatase-like hydrolase/transferase [Verrucomicrobia bacterium]|nr:sulfatase-like hydrolase/transferase [Verrucomicrobiota bacterium]
MADTNQPQSKRWRNLAVALSLANLCLINSWFATLFDADEGYFNGERVSDPALLALGSLLLALTALFFLGAQWVRRSSSVWVRGGAFLGVMALLLPTVEFVRGDLCQVTDREALVFLKTPWVWAAALLALAVSVRWLGWVIRGVRFLLFLLFPLACFTLVRVALLLLHLQSLHQHPGRAASLPPLSTNPPAQRVMWILFDEWDQRVSFDERPASVRLPEVDRLCRESLCASNAYPPFGCTFGSLPALTTGLPVAGVEVTGHSELKLELEQTNGAVRWSEVPNIFSRVRELGCNTALVGWYHPYSRLLGKDLNYVEWHAMPSNERGLSASFLDSIAQQLLATLPALQRRLLQVHLYRHMLAQSLEVVTDPQFNLALLHLPVPHKPCIYRPAQDRLTPVGAALPQGYLHNLVLMDRTLGRLRRAMEDAGTWNTSWLIVTTDHHWRESECLDGKRDLRIPFIVKPPGRGEFQALLPEINTRVTHDLILALLRQELADIPSVKAWLETHRLPRARALDNPPRHPSSLND